MSEEQIKIWEKVEAKGLEKLGNIEKALLAKEGFKEAHKDYCDFLNADEENFKHDFAGIQRNIVRNQYPAIDFGDCIPRFAGKSA